MVSALAIRTLARRQRDVALRAARRASIVATLSTQTRIAVARGTLVPDAH
jgi:hypothetical protein